MANPWDNDPIITPAPAQASAGNPWDNDPIVGEPDALEIDIIGGTPVTPAQMDAELRHPDGRLTEAGWQKERDALAAKDPLEGMGAYRKYLAGVGESVADTIDGIKQVGTDAGRYFVEANPQLFDAATLDKIRAVQADQFADTASRKKASEALNSTIPGMFGNAVGTAAQIFSPGIALRGTGAAAAFLPRTIAGNVLQGGVVGGLQPVTGEGQRNFNALLGAGAGGAGAFIPKAVGSTVSLARNVAGGATMSGAERRAAQLIAGESADKVTLMQANPSLVPGVQRSLAEESLDPGIARLERQMRGQTNTFQPIDTANNAARVRSIEGFAGDEAAIRAAEKARGQATKPLLGAAYLDDGVDVAAIRSSLQGQIDANATRPSVQAALNDVNVALEKAGDDVYSLYGVRKYIGDLLSGKAGADKSYARAASKELKDIQGVLDDEIAKKSPSFEKYLQAYRSGSAPIDRMKTGQQLLAADSGGAVLDPQTGLQVLTPASFSRKARNLDAAAAKATGFKKARASQILQAEDLAAIRAVQDDLERQSFRATAGSGGNSMTAERLALQDKMGRSALGTIPVVGKFADFFSGVANQRTNERLSYLLANPAEARRVLAALNKQDRKAVTNALIQLSARGGIGASTLAE